jgi:hypothetical protein
MKKATADFCQSTRRRPRGHAFAEWVLRLLSGFVAGFGAGYVTHVVLDFGTPRCLPLIN